MPFNRPNEQDVFAFIANSHNLEGSGETKVTVGDITRTYRKQGALNLFADGHLQAIGHIFDMIDKDFFPVKDPVAVRNLPQSNAALFWLRDIHNKMMMPLTNDPSSKDDPNSIQKWTVGKYRQVDAYISLGDTIKPAPHPSLIPKILHNWINHVAEIHCQIKEKAKQPFGLSKEQAINLDKVAHESSILLSCLQPFQHASNRHARLVEHALRMQWRLPWKRLTPEMYDEFIEDVTAYARMKLPSDVAHAQSVK